jgi:hypothetical protein
MKKIVPMANPDCDDRITDVQYWLVECDKESGIPEREVGLNSENSPIMKMPYKENYGYWTDNNLLLDDFPNHFKVDSISQCEFDASWNLVE